MQRLPATGYRRMPWKNGGGETFEIAVSPAAATLDAMDWRISMAVVAGDGPFSSFPEVDRTLSIVEGAGLALDLGEGRGQQILTTDSAPLHFPADIPAAARLLDGTVTDLNVMTRRGRYRHAVRRIAVQGHETLEIGSDEAALFVCAGNLTVTARGNSLQCGPRDCVLFQAPPGRVELRPDAGSILLVIELGRITQGKHQ